MNEPDLTRGTKLYVPAPDTPYRTIIKPGSGCVGTNYGMGRIELYYEGGIYSQVNVRTFEEKVFHAWSRCVYRASTSAIVALDEGQLIEVGDVHSDGTFTVTDQVELDAWLGV